LAEFFGENPVRASLAMWVPSEKIAGRKLKIACLYRCFRDMEKTERFRKNNFLFPFAHAIKF
jgi:hypothetical protein